MQRSLAHVVCLVGLLAITPCTYGTWSIVIGDAESGEVAVGTVTCLNQFDLLAIVPVVVVGKGSAAVQAAGDFDGVRRPIIFDELMMGTPPAEILEIVSHISGHEDRQYGIVDTHGGTVTFSGAENFQWAGGVVGSQCSMFYAIQGNILAGGCVVPAIEQAVLNTDGDIPARLMAGMQAARAQGGDGRCSCSPANPTGCGCPPANFTKSGHIGGMVAARIGDSDDPVCNAGGCADGDYFMRLNVAFQENQDPDPVMQLQDLFDAWRMDHVGVPDAVHSLVTFDPATIPPDGTSQTTMTITLRDWQDLPITAPIKSLTVEHAAESAGISTIGDIVDNGNGNYEVTLTAGITTGLDRFVVNADDGLRPVILMPQPLLETCTDDCQLDCNDNGVSDACDIGNGTSQDCNANVIPDECEIEQGSSDCNQNFIPDECEDCNNNGLADECDILSGKSMDIDQNGIPDECYDIFFVPDGHPTIQSAIDSAADGDTVLVAGGVYSGMGNQDLDFGGRNMLVKCQNGDQNCVIDCQGAGRGFCFQSGETSDAVVEGFTITNGQATEGGAISCLSSHPTIRYCVLDGNNADSLGGGLYCEDARPAITKCTIVNNSSGSRGGGAHVEYGSAALFQSCLFAGNQAASIGGSLSVLDSSPILEHVTSSENSAGVRGGAFYVSGASSPELSMSILWGDTAPDGPEIYLGSVSSSLDVSYSDVQGGPDAVEGSGTLNWLMGNLDVDPGLTDPASGDFHLSSGSAAIDAGDPDFVPDPNETDLDGNPRVIDGNGDGQTVTDMGAFEASCAGDVNGDLLVGIKDLLALLADWGVCPGCPADVDGDNIVGINDLLMLLAGWGTCG